ncbi:hypothetical protein B0H17DRAFT_1126341 [Mycena rosella]|uniref:Uncharacterized protein n=1 Tax=Mycena rosella TaxID=1033263 RepID=A0AAD7GUK1_MYCRO|nr:hypothetical protein B0H17DRAFT_1126341 [Mycena rosella]
MGFACLGRFLFATNFSSLFACPAEGTNMDASNRVHGFSTMEAEGSGGSATSHRLPNDTLLDGGDNAQGCSETGQTGAAPQQGRVQVRLVNDERPNTLPADAYGMQEGMLERIHMQNAQRLEQPETENGPDPTVPSGQTQNASRPISQNRVQPTMCHEMSISTSHASN